MKPWVWYRGVYHQAIHCKDCKPYCELFDWLRGSRRWNPHLSTKTSRKDKFIRNNNPFFKRKREEAKWTEDAPRRRWWRA